MKHLHRQKDLLLNQLKMSANTLGLTHPETVKKSQELDVIINQIMEIDTQTTNVTFAFGLQKVS